MECNGGNHYLYRHIRVDKNEPFYIGIGTKNKKQQEAAKRQQLFLGKNAK